MKNDAQEGEHHAKQHPHIDQLHICSLRQGVGDPSEAEIVLIKGSGGLSANVLTK